MKTAVRFALAALASSLFLSCVSTPSPREQKLGEYYVQSGKSWTTSAKFTKPAPWKAGQYVVTGTKNNGKLQSISKTLIVSKEKTGWILEISSMPVDGKDSVSQYLLEGYDEAVSKGDMSRIRFGWMKTRDEKGVISTISGKDMEMINAMSKSTFDSMVVSFKTFVDGGELKVPAGSFPGSNKIEAKVKIFGFDVETISWYHPSVPVNGMVKSMGKDGKSVTELLSFGTDGKPELPLK